MNDYTRIFLEKYNLPILKGMLKDENSRLEVYFKNNKVPISNYSCLKSFSDLSIKRNLVTQAEIENFIKKTSFSQKILSDKYIIDKNAVHQIMNRIDCAINFSSSESVLWSDELLDKYKDKWSWRNLSSNRSIFWSKERIYKFENYIFFNLLSGNNNIEIDREILFRYEDKWDWNLLSGNQGVGKQIGNLLVNHPKAKWTSFPQNDNYRAEASKKIKWQNDEYPSYSYKREITSSIKPCICTNKGIEWTLENFKKYESKIDVWLLALYGKLNQDVIREISDKLNENRVFYIKFTRYSDWRDSHPVYRNGWENLLLNENVSVDSNILKFLNRKNVKLLIPGGNAMKGHTISEKVIKANELVLADDLEINFEEACRLEHIIPKHILSSNHIDRIFYLKTIKPALVNNEDLVYSLFKFL